MRRLAGRARDEPLNGQGQRRSQDEEDHPDEDRDRAPAGSRPQLVRGRLSAAVFRTHDDPRADR
jgi:hypothetical protein